MPKAKRQRTERGCRGCGPTGPSSKQVNQPLGAVPDVPEVPQPSQSRSEGTQTPGPDTQQANRGHPDVAEAPRPPIEQLPQPAAVQPQVPTGAPQWQGPPPNPMHPVPPASLEDIDIDSSDSEMDALPGLDNVVNNHVNNLIGTPYVESVATPLAHQISKPLRRKVWANQFVDFAVLLPSSDTVATSDTNPKFQLQWDAGSNLSLVPSHKARRITNIDTWTTAFLRFVAIYCAKSPYEAPALMKYGDTIRRL